LLSDHVSCSKFIPALSIHTQGAFRTRPALSDHYPRSPGMIEHVPHSLSMIAARSLSMIYDLRAWLMLLNHPRIIRT
jgi:hypothetical protein